MNSEGKVALAFLLTLAIVLAVPIYGLREPGLRLARAQELNEQRLVRGAELYVKILAPKYGTFGEGGPAGFLRGTDKLSNDAEVRKLVGSAGEGGLSTLQADDLAYFLLSWNADALRKAAGILPEVAVEVWDSGWEPQTVSLTDGERVRLRLVNFGSATYSVAIDGLEAKLADGSVARGLSLEAEAGKEASIVIAARDTGRYVITCTGCERPVTATAKGDMLMLAGAPQ